MSSKKLTEDSSLRNNLAVCQFENMFFHPEFLFSGTVQGNSTFGTIFLTDILARTLLLTRSFVISHMFTSFCGNIWKPWSRLLRVALAFLGKGNSASIPEYTRTRLHPSERVLTGFGGEVRESSHTVSSQCRSLPPSCLQRKKGPEMLKISTSPHASSA